MASQMFTDEAWKEAKNVLPDWLLKAILKKARAKAGGKTKAMNREKCMDDKVKKVFFVESEFSPMEKARREALVGQTGVMFQRAYLEPLGVTKSDVVVTSLGEIPNLEMDDSSLVVALGKEARQKLGDIADFSLPHPDALLKYGDSGEVGRKCRKMRDLLEEKKAKVDVDEEEGMSEESLEGDKKKKVEKEDEFTSVAVQKAETLKKIVYGVVLDPYGNTGNPEPDAHRDWMPPNEVEKTAHAFMQSARVIKLQHAADSNAKVVESWVEPYPEGEYQKAIKGEDHKIYERKFGDDYLHSGSWVLGVQLSDAEWGMYEKGLVNAFSPGGFGARRPLMGMPKVNTIRLIEAAVHGEAKSDG